nr:MAG TPA_asm: Protein of unknown function (DUF3168) [Caudoviricetes sp.]
MSNLHLAHTRVATHLAENLDVRTAVGEPQQHWGLPYCFVWGPLPNPAAAPMVTVDESLMVQVVAASVPAVNALASDVCAALEDFVPSIPGWECHPVRVTHTTSATTLEARSTEPLTNLRPAWLTVTFRFRARRTQ